MKIQKFRTTIFVPALVVISVLLRADFSIGQVPTLPKELWIAVRTDGQPGTGTIIDPYDGSTAAKLDALMNSYQSTYGIVWNFGEGEFQTDAAHTWYIRRDWVMQGRGMDRTTLKMVGNLSEVGAQGVASAIKSQYYPINQADNAVVRNMTIDQNWGNLATTAPVGAGSKTVGGGVTTNASSTVRFANTTIASGSNGAAFPQSTVNVVSTADFPSSGSFWIRPYGYYEITYTGKTATSFTGCSGGAGTMLTGQAVSSVNLNFAHDFARTVAGTGIPISPAPTVLRIPATTIGASSNGASLPQTTIYATSTADFASAGSLLVETSTDKWQEVSYSGKTSTTFTGCSGGTGTMTIGGSINTATQLVMTSNATASGTQVSVALGGERNVKTNAVTLIGNNNLIENVRAINSYGSADNNLEGFVLSIFAPDNQYADAVTSVGSVMRFNRVESIYGTYASPYQVGGGQYGDFKGRMAHAKVYGNYAYGVNDGQFNVFTSGGINTSYLEDSEIYDNHMVDCMLVYYNDTGSNYRNKVYGNTGIRASQGMSVITTDLVEDLEIYGNKLSVQNRFNGGHAYGIIISRFSGEMSDRASVHDNTITWESTGRGYNWFRHLLFNHLRDSAIINNICDEMDGGTNCYPQNVSLFNNRTSAGKILTALCGSFEDNIIPPIPPLCGDRGCD